MQYKAFIGGSNTSQSPIADCQRTVNLYVEILESIGAKTVAALYPFPGLSSLFSAVQGPVKAIGFQDGRGFAVIGFKLYEFFADWTTTDRGDVASDDNPATISFNSHGSGEVFITSGNEGYIFTLATNVLTNVVSDVTQGGFIDGYFTALDAATSTLKISDLEDGTTWNPLQIAQRQGAGDPWVSMIVKNREIWLMGSQTSEVWVNVGAYPFPFAMIQQGLIQKGSAAAFSVAAIEDSLLWLMANEQGQGIVCRSEGYLGVRISTHAVEFAIQGYGTISDAIGYSYQTQGHTFYILNFPTADATWVYDTTTGLWTERLLWNATTGLWEAHRGVCHAFAFGTHVIGDRSTGTVYEEAVTIFTDAGDVPLRRLRRAPHMANEGKYLFYHRFQLDMETGVGLATGQGDDPQIMLRYSDDGGRTWSNELWTTAGAIGVYRTQAVWRMLGAGRDRVFEVSFSDPVPFRLNNAWLDVSAGVAA